MQGNTVLPQGQLAPDYAALIDKTVQLDDVNAAAARLTAHYRGAGYLLAQAIVPEQDVSEGELVIQIYEGYIDEVVYKGDNIPPAVKRYGAKIRAQRPLTAHVLERYLLLINDIPGITAYGAIAQSQTPGAAQLTILVAARRFGGDVSVDNRITHSLGNVRLEGLVDVTNLLRAQDSFTTNVIASQDARLLIGELGWEEGWGTEGLKTALSVSSVYSRPRVTPREKSTSDSAAWTMSYPVLRSRSANLYVRGTLAALDSRSQAVDFDVPPLFDDRVRAFRIGISSDLADSLGGVNLVDVEYSHGIDGIGARKPDGLVPLSRNGATNTFEKVTLYLSRLQSVTSRLSMLFAATGQATDKTLFSSEQFSAGGEQFLRAYDASELIGDRGLAAKVELRLVPWWESLLTYGFYDYGHVGNVAATNAILTGTTSGSAGLGLRYTRGALAAYVEGAKPIARDVVASGKRTVRAFGGLKYSF